MTDELPEHSHSAFWPVLILLVALAISGFYQLYVLLSQRSAINQQYANATAPGNLDKAKAAQNQLLSLWKDLNSVAEKDTNAASIVREVKQSGLIRENPTAPGGTNVAPANPTP